jgi:hypothetical protein
MEQMLKKNCHHHPEQHVKSSPLAEAERLMTMTAAGHTNWAVALGRHDIQHVVSALSRYNYGAPPDAAPHKGHTSGAMKQEVSQSPAFLDSMEVDLDVGFIVEEEELLSSSIIDSGVLKSFKNAPVMCIYGNIGGGIHISLPSTEIPTTALTISSGGSVHLCLILPKATRGRRSKKGNRLEMLPMLESCVPNHQKYIASGGKQDSEG